MTTKHPLNLMAEHLAARSKDIADRDKVIEELLEALEAMCEYHFVVSGEESWEYNKARAAIAKATS
jgi:hypothetical protein